MPGPPEFQEERSRQIFVFFVAFVVEWFGSPHDAAHQHSEALRRAVALCQKRLHRRQNLARRFLGKIMPAVDRAAPNSRTAILLPQRHRIVPTADPSLGAPQHQHRALHTMPLGAADAVVLKVHGRRGAVVLAHAGDHFRVMRGGQIIVQRLLPLLAGPEAGVLAAQGQLTLASLEALFADLPGDQREKLQEALGSNPTATMLVDVDPTDLLAGFSGSAAEKKIASWRSDTGKQHRIALAVTGLRAFIAQPSRLAELKRSNIARQSLGHLLMALHERHAMPLVETLKRVGITPVRPGG